MIILDNREAIGEFTLVLRDKITRPDPHLYLQLIKQDDLQTIYYHMDVISTNGTYTTYSIPTSNLEEGQYRAFVFEGDPIDAEDCDLDAPETIILGTYFECDPVTLTAIVTLEDEMVIGSEIANIDVLIYKTIARVDGAEYNTVYRNESSPEYTTYNE